MSFLGQIPSQSLAHLFNYPPHDDDGTLFRECQLNFCFVSENFILISTQYTDKYFIQTHIEILVECEFEEFQLSIDDTRKIAEIVRIWPKSTLDINLEEDYLHISFHNPTIASRPTVNISLTLDVVAPEIMKPPEEERIFTPIYLAEFKKMIKYMSYSLSQDPVMLKIDNRGMTSKFIVENKQISMDFMVEESLQETFPFFTLTRDGVIFLTQQLNNYRNSGTIDISIESGKAIVFRYANVELYMGSE